MVRKDIIAMRYTVFLITLFISGCVSNPYFVDGVQKGAMEGYDANEANRPINANEKNKKINQKATVKYQEAQQKHLASLNKSKFKKINTDRSFKFY
ncbi:MAG: hypothetical protein NZ529_03405 [Cytophagaceae bacterium]|nr:hypothetical protein [Cytophagaceae bacterium]MDW8455816.1 hypothetical protein [Cytophagaceae bacterium]